MSMCRRFMGEPVVRLIVTVPADLRAGAEVNSCAWR